MATAALTLHHGLMGDAAQKRLTVRTMRIMTEHATALHGEAIMFLAKDLIRGVAGKTEFVSSLLQQEIGIRAMVQMAGGAPLFDRSMNILSQNGFAVMTGKTEV